MALNMTSDMFGINSLRAFSALLNYTTRYLGRGPRLLHFAPLALWALTSSEFARSSVSLDRCSRQFDSVVNLRWSLIAPTLRRISSRFLTAQRSRFVWSSANCYTPPFVRSLRLLKEKYLCFLVDNITRLDV